LQSNAEDIFKFLNSHHSLLTIDDVVEIRKQSGLEEVESLSLRRGTMAVTVLTGGLDS
jgi:hypothetical protein